MALTEQQQLDLELFEATESIRHANQIEFEAKRQKFEMIRLAKEVLLENSRSKPVDSREVTAEHIETFTEKLMSYVLR